MGAADSIPKFFNPEMPPRPGGWHFWLDPDNKSYPINSGTAEGVFEQIKRYQENNRRFKDADSIWRALWQYWCSLEPNRCGASMRQIVKDTLPGKEFWGPILWRMLNWAAVNFNRPFFLSLVEEMRVRLIICPDCRNHFEELLQRFPLSGVNSQVQACLWAHQIHNEVNRRIGKPTFLYSQAITEYGFPTP